MLITDARPSSGTCDGHEFDDPPFTVGSRFHDTASNTTIDVISQAGDDYRITIAFGVAPQSTEHVGMMSRSHRVVREATGSMQPLAMLLHRRTPST
ncbi:hypothetical protein AB0G02_34665 [Actinosynnema sp. NPDC023658]|uniref:hypothetical protein n=1 Tax=Actinosynnema sp. NPDC023658 TaxID=3155465 RepID=UPI0033C92B59